jgi:hypothetical protein
MFGCGCLLLACFLACLTYQMPAGLLCCTSLQCVQVFILDALVNCQACPCLCMASCCSYACPTCLTYCNACRCSSWMRW